MKCMHRIVSLVLTLFLFISSFMIPASASGGTVKKGVAFITASSLRLRSGPSTASRTVDYGYQDEIVVLLGRSGSWYHVIYDLQEGYMHSSWLDTATVENAELGYGAVNGSGVNVRTGPGTSYSSRGRAERSEKVYIIGINNGWYKVIWGDVIGYIRSDYVDLTQIPYENRASDNEPLFFVKGRSTGVTPSAAALRGDKQDTSADAIIATAKQYIGTPYLWGGTTPGGFDCSGFVQFVFKKHGIDLPRTSSQQYKVGTPVSRSALKKGDLVFFGTDGVSHLGIYIGDGKFIHSSSSKGVTITALNNSYWNPRYYGARRNLE